MAMIASWHGHDIDLTALRKRYSVPLTGATLRNLMSLGDQLGFSSRALRADLAALGHVRCPAILHWDLNHFVVLKEVKRRTALIHDPAFGVRELPLERVSDHFTGVVLEFTKADDFSSVTVREPVKLSSLWSRLKGFWPSFGHLLALSVLLQLMALALPLQIQLVVDQAILAGDLDLLGVLALGFGAIVIVQASVEWVRAWSVQVLGHMMTFQVIGNLVRHLIRLPGAFFERRHVGDILSRVDSGSQIQDVLTRGAISIVLDGLMALATGVVLLIYAPLLALVAVAAIAVHVLFLIVVFRPMRMRIEEEIVQRARERSHIMETVRAAITFKVMGGEAVREGGWRNIYAGVINASISVGEYSISTVFIQRLTSALSGVIIVWLGARAVIEASGFSVGMLFAFLAFRETFSERMFSLVNEITKLQFLRVHLERMNDIVSAEPEDPAGQTPTISLRGGMTIKNVTFKYGATSVAVLQNVSFDVRPGEFLAITGPSGGGKTTLLKLLLGLYLPTDGGIDIDGAPATPAAWIAARQRVGVVLQDDRLLSGTLADNIAFFDPELGMERVIEAAKAAAIHDEIMALPMQYLSLVGDMGSTLSGGQKQRVLLARALYRAPDMLFLDEGTANLDEAAEALIVELVSRLDMTRIVIAHRPALLRRADRVAVVRDAKVSFVDGERTFLTNITAEI